MIAVAVFVAMLVETLTSSQREVGVVVTVIGLAALTAPLALRTRFPLASAVAVFVRRGAYSLLLTPLTYGVTPIVLLAPAAVLGRRTPDVADRRSRASSSASPARSAFEPAVGPAIAIALVWAGRAPGARPLAARR